MSNLFENYPQILYKNILCKNLVIRSAIIQDVFNKHDSFYPYIVKEQMLPWHVAYEQYDNPSLDWVVLYSNQIIDPIYQWPLDYQPFIDYIEQKHGKSKYQLQSETKHYIYAGTTDQAQNDIDRVTWTMSVDTHTRLAPNTAGWTALSTYDYESQLNENRRSIRLLDKIYLPQIQNELNRIFANENI